MNKIIEELYNDHIKKGEDWIECARELYDIQMEIRILQKKEEIAKEMLKRMSNNINSFGGGFAFTCTERIGSINYKNIPGIEEIDLDLYRGSSVMSWSLKKV